MRLVSNMNMRKSVAMKTRREVKAPETIRSPRGLRIVGQKDSSKKSQEDAIMHQNSMKEVRLRQYYQEGEVYAFTISSCISDTNPDGTQQTKYTVKDKHGDKHYHYCDCTCFEIGKEVYLRIDKIVKGQLKFESSIIERLDEIFIKGKEYEFEVHNYQNGRYAVRDKQIGKNHYLKETNSTLYQKLQELKLEVQDYDNEGNLVLIDRNPPTPTPCINALQQLLTETEEKSQKCETQQEPRIEGFQTSALDQTNQPSSTDTPKVAPGIPVHNENKKVPVATFPSFHKVKEHAQQRQPSPIEAVKAPQETKQEKAITDEAENLYQQGKSAAENGHKSEARKFFIRAANMEHQGAIAALGKLYLAKALKFIKQAAERGNSDAQTMLAMLLDQVFNEEGGAGDVDLKVDKRSRAGDAGTSRAGKHNQQARKECDTVPTPTKPTENSATQNEIDDARANGQSQSADNAALTTEEPIIEQTERSGSDTTACETHMVDLTRSVEGPKYYAWLHGNESVSKIRIAITAVPKASTESHGCDEESDKIEIPHIVGEPEVICAKTESSGHEKVESEQHDIEFSDTPPAPVAGCICCRFIQRIKNLFSQLTRH